MARAILREINIEVRGLLEKFVKISVIRGLKTWFCYRTSKKKAFMTETYHKGFLFVFFY